jgi:hypothetical protein
MPTAASSPPTTSMPASHTATALVPPCHEDDWVRPVQGRRIALDQQQSAAGAKYTTGPTAENALRWRSVRGGGIGRLLRARGRGRDRATKPGNMPGRRLRHRAAGSLRSQGPPRGLRWIGEREVDWTDTANCDDRRFILAADHPVVMRSSSHAVHEAAGRRRHARSGVEISAAVDPPTAGDNDAEPIARISMRRAHVSRMPADEDIVEAWRSAVPGQTTNVGAALRKRGLRFPLQRAGQLDDGLRRIERTGGRTRWPEGQRRKK